MCIRDSVARARNTGIRGVVAHPLPELSESTSVLKRCGFTHLGEISDPDEQVDGVVWRWELLLMGSDNSD